MAYTVHFQGPPGAPHTLDDLAAWLADNAEPVEIEGTQTLALRAIPIRLILSEEGKVRADVEISATCKLDRIVDLVFHLALELGSDVRLSDTGKLTRGDLWMRLADEQDRLCICEALTRAEEHGRRESVAQDMWAVLASASPGRDVRWDTNRRRIVELVEVGEQLSVEDARWHDENVQPGDVVAIPIERSVLHLVAWRWLRQTHPSLTPE